MPEEMVTVFPARFTFMFCLIKVQKYNTRQLNTPTSKPCYTVYCITVFCGDLEPHTDTCMPVCANVVGEGRGKCVDVSCKGWVEGEESVGGQREAGVGFSLAMMLYANYLFSQSLLHFILSFYFTFIFPFSLSSSSCFFFLSCLLKCPLPPTPLACKLMERQRMYFILY